jgi:SAM-dependent methyltransferase
MSRWQEYYQNLTISDFIGNLFGQRELLEEIVKLKPGKILEVGAGSGGLSIFLSQLGFEITASDSDEAVLEIIRQNNERFGGKIKDVILADGFRLPFANDSFDLIFHQGVIEHFSDSEIVRFITEQLRVAPKVLAAAPNQNYPRQDLGDERLISGQAWRSVLKDFKVIWQKDYSPKVFPRFFLPRAKIQHMILIER